MPEIKLKTRIQNKYKTIDEWNLIATGEFVPLKGEVCYGIQDNLLYQKIGDGTTDFTNLPWLLNQADYNENNENSPSFIKNKPISSDFTEVPKDEQVICVDKYVGQDMLDTGSVIVPIADLAAMWGSLEDTVLAMFPNTTNIVLCNQWNDSIYVEKADDLLNSNHKLLLQIQDKNQIVDIDFSSSNRNVSPTHSIEGLSLGYFGNGYWANLIANFLLGTAPNLIEYFPVDSKLEATLETKYCIFTAGPTAVSDDDGAMMMTFFIADSDYYQPQEIIDADTGETSYEYPFALSLLARGSIATIDPKFLGDIQADQNETDDSKVSYIKNKYGAQGILEVDSNYPNLGDSYYSGTITLNGISLLGSIGIKKETVSTYMAEGLLSQLETCKVNYNGDWYPNCPVMPIVSLFNSDDVVQYGIGNPALYFQAMNELFNYFMQTEGVVGFQAPKGVEDNGYPFFFGMTDGTGSPVSDATWAIFKEVGGSKATFSLEVHPEKVRMITKQISPDMVPFAYTGTTYNGINNSVLMNGAYSATGTNSLAAGSGTIASGYSQTVVGQMNKEDTGALFIVGNGFGDTRKNALTVDGSGTTKVQKLIGKESIGGSDIKVYTFSGDYVSSEYSLIDKITQLSNKITELETKIANLEA